MRINGGWLLGLGGPLLVALVTYIGHSAAGLSVFESACFGLIVALGLALLGLTAALRNTERRIKQDVGDLEARLATTSRGQVESEAKLALLIEHARRIAAEPRPASASDLDVLGSLLRELAEAVSSHENAVQTISQKLAVVEATPPVYIPVAPHIPEPVQRVAMPVVPQAPLVAPAPTPGPIPSSPRIAAAREAARAAMRGEPRVTVPAQPVAVQVPIPPLQAGSPVGTPHRVAPPPAAQATSVAMPETPEQRQAREAIANDQFELFLQPIVSLPQRKTRLYETSLRPLDAAGNAMPGYDLHDIAARSGLAARLDRGMATRVLRLIRVFRQRGREATIICSLTAAGLADAETAAMLRRFASEEAELAASLILALSQSALGTLSPIEVAMLDDLARAGIRIAMMETRDLRLNPQELSDRGIRYVKIASARLLEAASGEGAGLEIHVADLGGLLARHGISLIADGVASEQTVLDMLDFVIPLAQGDLFSPPRQVRAEILEQARAVDGARNQAQAEAEPRVSFRSLLRRASV